VKRHSLVAEQNSARYGARIITETIDFSPTPRNKSEGGNEKLNWSFSMEGNASCADTTEISQRWSSTILILVPRSFSWT
jgi:hypothetical protein